MSHDFDPVHEAAARFLKRVKELEPKVNDLIGMDFARTGVSWPAQDNWEAEREALEKALADAVQPS